MTADLDLIRRAANQMRELAKTATPGPWFPGATSSAHTVVGAGRNVVTMGQTKASLRNMQHIAKWDPVTALAVADSLDGMAALLEEAGDGPLAIVARGIAEKSIAVARAFLKEDA